MQVVARATVCLHVDAVHAAQALDQRAGIRIAVRHACGVGFLAGLARRQRIRGRTDGAGKTDGGAKDEYGFFYIDHFYPIPKELSRYKKPLEDQEPVTIKRLSIDAFHGAQK